MDDCFRAVSDLGADQHIEIIGGQLIKTYPYLSPSEEARIRHLIDDHGLTRSSYCSYVDRGRRKGATASDEEALRFVMAEIELAHRLGYSMIRLNPPTPKMILSLMPELERLGIKLAIELHSERVESPAVQALLELFQKQGSDLVGFLQDMGAYTLRVPDVYIDYGKRTGVPPHLVDLVVRSWNESRPLSDTLDELAGLSEGAGALDYARVCYSVYVHGSIDTLDDVLPYLQYVHSKLYGMDAHDEEPAVPYREIIRKLVESGFEGVISSEYGGGLFSPTPDCFVQLSRQQAMIRRLWGEAVAARDDKTDAGATPRPSP